LITLLGLPVWTCPYYRSPVQDDIPDAPIQDMHTMHTTMLPQEVEVGTNNSDTVDGSEILLTS